MASTELVAFERDLNQMAPQLAQAIPPAANLPVERMIRTIVISCERAPRLLECSRQSVINAAWSAAVLGLEVDGVSGQAYLVPYKGTAQLQIGFKGFGTLAARAGFILNGGVIREGDDYDVRLGTGGFIHVRPQLGGRANRRILAAYATLESHAFPPIVDLMDIDEIEKARAVSQTKRSDSPWNSWYDQMAIKTVKKRLAKSTPLIDLQKAAVLDDQGSVGQSSYLRQDGVLVVDHQAYPDRSEGGLDPERLKPLPKWIVHMVDGSEREYPGVDRWRDAILRSLQGATDAARLDAWYKANLATFEERRETVPQVRYVEDEIKAKIEELGADG